MALYAILWNILYLYKFVFYYLTFACILCQCSCICVYDLLMNIIIYVVYAIFMKYDVLPCFSFCLNVFNSMCWFLCFSICFSLYIGCVCYIYEIWYFSFFLILFQCFTQYVLIFDVSAHVYLLYIFTLNEIFGCYIYYISVVCDVCLVNWFRYPIIVAVRDILSSFLSMLIVFFFSLILILLCFQYFVYDDLNNASFNVTKSMFV